MFFHPVGSLSANWFSPDVSFNSEKDSDFDSTLGQSHSGRYPTVAWLILEKIFKSMTGN
jgi:hypothetical protein